MKNVNLFYFISVVSAESADVLGPDIITDNVPRRSPPSTTDVGYYLLVHSMGCIAFLLSVGYQDDYIYKFCLR